ncbi:MAG: hypothetical protein WCK83_16250, partial [Burkholderiales bacterium]
VLFLPVIVLFLPVIANEVKQSMNPGLHGLPRRFASRNDEIAVHGSFAVSASKQEARNDGVVTP